MRINGRNNKGQRADREKGDRGSRAGYMATALEEDQVLRNGVLFPSVHLPEGSAGRQRA